MTMPAVTVLMPVHNAARYVRAAVASILGQTWTDFELLVVNDGSTDGTRAVLDAVRDSRIRIVDTEHLGLAAALRRGVELARGAYIARMDADDESLPRRLEIQKACLDRDPGVVLVHALAEAIDEEGHVVLARYGNPRSDAVTRWLLCWQNVPVHPTVMLRAAVVRDRGVNYRREAAEAEDFDLWNRLALEGRFHVLPEVLLRYRIHPESFTQSGSPDRRIPALARVIAERFARHGLPIPEPLAAELVVLSGTTRASPLSARYPSLVGRLHRILDELSGRLAESLGIDPDELAPVQAEQLVRWARYMANTSPGYALTLLVRAARRHRAVLGTPLFWAVAASLGLPRAVRARLDAARARPIAGPAAATGTRSA